MYLRTSWVRSFFLDLRTSLVHVGVRLFSGSVSISNPWWGPFSFQDLLLTHGGVRPLLGLLNN